VEELTETQVALEAMVLSVNVEVVEVVPQKRDLVGHLPIHQHTVKVVMVYQFQIFLQL
tara:strand:- start:352 stop:525 length:174 start_codon:yes stop_codon:yes gene_type:complete